MSEQWQSRQTSSRPAGSSGEEEDRKHQQQRTTDEFRDSSRLSPSRQRIGDTSPSSTFRVPQSSLRGPGTGASISGGGDYTDSRSPFLPRIPPFNAILDTSANNSSSSSSFRLDTGSTMRSSGSTSASTPSTNSASSSSREASRFPVDHAWRPSQYSTASLSSSSSAASSSSTATATAITGLGMPAPPDLSRPLSASSSSSRASSSGTTPFHTARTLPPPPFSASNVSSRLEDRSGPSRTMMNPDSRSTSNFTSVLHNPSSSSKDVTATIPSPYITPPSYQSSANSSQLDHSKSSITKIAPSASPDTRPKPSVEGFSRSRNGKKYRLIVVQHPTRARMCGFGDKDRRPLSPTLIVKLVVTDEATGKEIPPWDVNTSLFFLASDLCHPDELILSPRNVLVHHHAASVPTAMLQQQQQQQQQMNQQSDTSHETSLARKQHYNTSPYSGYSSYNSSHNSSNIDIASNEMELASQRGHPSSSGLTTFTTEHYTRNLVGAAVTGANVLRDEQDVHTIFFVLQDLSIRTEGVYRIRLIFTDLAQQDGATNEGVSEALAEAYTEPFSVYSPRRFPGMLEPTELSKKLASQGIKIAVRSDKKKRRRDSAERESQTGGTDAPVDAAEEEEE